MGSIRLYWDDFMIFPIYRNILIASNLKGLLLFFSFSVYFGKEPEVLLSLETKRNAVLLLSFFWSSPIIIHCRQLCVAFVDWWLLNNWSWDVKYFFYEFKVQSKSRTATTTVRHFNMSASVWFRAVMLPKTCMWLLGGRKRKKIRIKKKDISFCNN